MMHRMERLQWGRATEGPERNLVRVSPPWRLMLQWGRATEGPERQSEEDLERMG